ncbi:FadR family transcriptional regulator [Parasalinivibrio latis]|uniref:FadR/GntR family transcriptional regulator n=1 Tax=Parasalinivibrio latis TaxID=2952610 RepID=UPI0030E04BB4
MTNKNQGRLYLTVANEMIDRIKQKQYAVGDKIPPERKLSEELGVSRTVIREAMVYLELIGVATIKKGAGVYVTNSEPTQGNSQIPEYTPYHILHARKVIEGGFARAAAESKTDSLVEELERCIAMMEASLFFSDKELRHKASIDADRQFHALISSVCDNPILETFHGDLMSMHLKGKMWMRMESMAENPAAQGRWIKDHKKIFTAIKSGDGDAAEAAMVEHLDNVINILCG